MRNIYLINLSFGLAGIERRFANLWHALRARGNVRPILVIPDTLSKILCEANLLDLNDDLLWSIPENSFIRSVAQMRLPSFCTTPQAILRTRTINWWGYRLVWDRIIKDPSAVIHIGMNCSALRPPNVPIVYECVDSTLSQLGTRHFIRAALRPSIIHCQTERIRLALERMMMQRRTYCTTVTSPCYFASYPAIEMPQSRDPHLVVFVGRLSPEKNPMLFVDAMARVRAKGVACRGLMLGEGSLMPELLMRIRQLGLDKTIKIEFSKHPTTLISKAAVFVTLQSGDNYGSQSLLEAMSVGCAVVATDVGETRRVVTEAVGQVVKPDVIEVSEAILSLVGYPDLALRKGMAASRLVRTHYTAEKYAAFIETLYERAAEVYHSVQPQKKCVPQL